MAAQHRANTTGQIGRNTDSRPGGATVLSLWFFKFAGGDELGIILEGYRCDDEFGTNLVNWGSSPIVRRINATTLATKSNSRYILEGPICEKAARELGLPVSLISMFQHGFPENWMTVLQAYWNKLRETNALNASHWFDKTSHLYDINNPLNLDVSRIVKYRPSMARKSILPPPNTAPSPLVEESDSIMSTPRSTAGANRRKTPTASPTKPPSTSQKAILPPPTSSTAGANKRRQTVSPQKRPSTSQRTILPPPMSSSNDSEKVNTAEQAESVTDATNNRRARSRSTTVSPTEVRRSPRLSNSSSRLGLDKSKQQALIVRQRSSTVDSGLNRKTLFTPAPVHQMRRAISDNKMNDEAKDQRSKNHDKIAPIFSSKGTPSKKISSKDEVNHQKKRSSSVVTIRSPAVIEVAEPALISPKRSFPKEKFVAPTPDTRGAGKRASRLSCVKFADEREENPKEVAAEDIPVVRSSEVRSSNHQFPFVDQPSTSRVMCVANASKHARNTDSKWKHVHKNITRWCIVFLDDDNRINEQLTEVKHPLFSITGFTENNIDAWSTSPIVDVRLNTSGSLSTLMMTMSKKVYKLEGDMDRKYMAAHGFSKKFLMDFRHGFPSNWIELLCEEKRRVRNSTSQSGNNRKFDATRVVDLTRTTSAPVITHPDDEVAIIGHSDFSNMPLLPDYQPPMDHDADIIAVSTITTERVANRRSSYGRTIHEPVQNWAGEHVRYSVNREHMGVEVPNRRRSKPFDNRLAVEKDGNKRKAVKRRMETYSDGSEDEELLVRNTRRAIEAPNYLDDSDSPIRKRDRKGRGQEIFSDSEEEQNHIEKKIADIQKEKKKLRRQLRSLEDQELKLEEEALEIRKRRKRLRKIREQKARFDREDGYSRHPARKAIEPPPPKKSKQTEQNHVPKKSRAKYDSDDSDFFRCDDDLMKDDKSSTETECSDGGDWRRDYKSKHAKENVVVKPKKKTSTTKKAPKKEEKNRKSSKEYASSDEDIFQEDVNYETSELGSTDDSDEYIDPVDERKKVITWKREDVDRLKRALDAIVIKSDGDWEKISRSMANKWSPEECRETAIKKLKWMPREPPKDNEVETAEPVVEVTSKKGTFKYAKETGQQLRDYMLKGGSQGDDYFGNRDRINSVEEQDTLEAAEDEPMEVNLDNSLLAAMKTPTVIHKKAPRRSEFYPDENTPSTSNDRDGSADELYRDVPAENVDRDQRTRYLHHLTQQNRSNLNNTTRANNSTIMNQRDADKTLADVTRQVDAIKKKTKQAMKKNKRLTEFEEDDEENEENDLFC